MLSPHFNISHLLYEFTEYLKGLKLIIRNVLFCNFSIFETDYFVPKFENHTEDRMKKFHDKPWKVSSHLYSV